MALGFLAQVHPGHCRLEGAAPLDCRKPGATVVEWTSCSTSWCSSRNVSIGLRSPYMLSGSVALSMYAQPRMTRDVDFVLDIEEAQVDKFVELFEADCYIDRESVLEAGADARDVQHHSRDLDYQGRLRRPKGSALSKD